ncbi:hypothetical protein FDB55_00190 [Clostridium botulinum]|uniref:Site-specific integrase n=2 Tax=Clostridium botulinum TaxID=1491 RepID=A0A0L9Y7Y8_CLOBO|nr:hypothetical protein [Clostridium botulinum]ALT05372.1 phage integrase family protein [Clostridium botulinum]KAI3349307.1 hypothetical protein CIT18_09370 [Clostridium botulinum]KOM87915.1 hypothetical protein ACP51_10110 [Clostridium botulinum]KOR61906.1 hypothetical protein ADT22_05050 [Clostridium botulinum]MCS6110840.1 hypothetical protein [Clostridium botulinum]
MFIISNVIELRNTNSKYRFKVKVCKYKREGRCEDHLFQKAIIVLFDNITGKSRVHEFTEFAIREFGKNRIKTQVDYLGKLVKFLNYVIKNKDKKNFKYLDFYDVEEFSQEIALDVQMNTFNIYKMVLSRFYRYLAQKEWLINVSINDFIIKESEKNGGVMIKYDIPICNIDIPNNIHRRNTHVMEYELQAMLLEVAIEEVNIIALAIFFQMFGGLRSGEIVNLTHSAVQCIGPYGRYGMLLDITDRNLRLDLKNNQAKGYSKKSRKQKVISPFNMLEKIYIQHMKKYKCVDDSGAIFVNKDGMPMTIGSYNYYFDKLKKIFLKRLKESDNPTLKVQGDILCAAKWKTHIGRGIFSNNLGEFMSASELKIARGDKYINSSDSYIEETKKIGKLYEENAEGAFQLFIKKINE